MSHPTAPISANAHNLIARVYEALGEGELKSDNDHSWGYTAGFSYNDKKFMVIMRKEFGIGYNNRIFVSFCSAGVQQENEEFGLKSKTITYSTSDIISEEGNSLKFLFAKELSRSGVDELEELGKQFARELKGEAPEPPLSKNGKWAYSFCRMRR